VEEPWAALSVAEGESVDEPCCAVEAIHAIGGHGHAEKCTGVGGEGSNKLLSLSQDFNRREQVQQLSLLVLFTVSEKPTVIVSRLRRGIQCPERVLRVAAYQMNEGMVVIRKYEHVSKR